MAETSVSIKRILRFMLIDETITGDPTPLNPYWRIKPIKDLAFKPMSLLPSYENPKVIVVHGIVKYGDDMCLEDINMEAWPGKITAIVGPVGAGKSCLMKLILGELSLFSGKLTVVGTMSYASQDPWLFAGMRRFISHYLVFM